MRARLPLLASALLPLLAACGDGPAAPLAARSQARPALSARAATAAADLYPAPAGAVWHYAQWGAQDDGPEAPQNPMTIRVTEAAARPDGTKVAFTRRDSASGQLPATRIVETASTVSLSRASDPEGGPSLAILRYPLQPGVAWKGRSTASGAVESVEPQGYETVTVPAGAFEAWRVDHVVHQPDGTEDRLNYWYAPGVGAVKLVERVTLHLADGSTRRLTVRGELTGTEGL